MRRLIVALTLLLLPVALYAYTSPGRPTGFVNDFANILSPATEALLNQELEALQKSHGAEVAVVTIPALVDETVETYAVKLFEEWGIGDEKLDTGLLLLVSLDDREVRIEVGYGLEHIITDIESGSIIRESIVPAFREGNYDLGVTGAIASIKKDIEAGEPLVSKNSPRTALPDLSGFFYPAVFLLVILASWLGKSKSFWMGGVLGFVVSVIIGLFLGITMAILAAIILTPLGLLFDFLVSRAHARHKAGGPPPWFGGGGGFGGGGFGGFGGGMSGGGGASGRW